MSAACSQQELATFQHTREAPGECAHKRCKQQGPTAISSPCPRARQVGRRPHLPDQHRCLPHHPAQPFQQLPTLRSKRKTGLLPPQLLLPALMQIFSQHMRVLQANPKQATQCSCRGACSSRSGACFAAKEALCKGVLAEAGGLGLADSLPARASGRDECLETSAADRQRVC